VIPTRRHVPFNVLAPGVAAIRDELDQAIGQVLDRGWFLMGPELNGLEQAFAAYHGDEFQAVGVGSGTDALRIGLQALGIEGGDEVLVTANAGVPPVAAVVAAGARPLFVDIDPSTHTLEPADIERRITPRARAILVVHLYGHPANMAAILPRARRYGLKILEDCAQAHGARTSSGQLVGTLGDAAAFSFYPTKNLGALGDAGAILTSNAEVAERARLLRMYGWRSRYLSEVHSTVSRMDEIQAAALSVKLRHLDEWNESRRQLAQRYRSGLRPTEGTVQLPHEEGVFHLFVIRSAIRDSLKQFLADNDVGTDIHYPYPVHLQQPYASYGAGAGSLPHTERAASEVLSLPIYPELSPEDVDYVCQLIRTHGA
jgi:dTDP-4-amino-4,6-dideoxygalactose transaminase